MICPSSNSAEMSLFGFFALPKVVPKVVKRHDHEVSIHVLSVSCFPDRITLPSELGFSVPDPTPEDLAVTMPR
ncbi:hypothetical protein Tco_1060382 [Tanacetum coccineum]